MTEAVTHENTSSLVAHLIKKEGNSTTWEPYFTVDKTAKDGYFKGEDVNGQTIVVNVVLRETANDGAQVKTKRHPDLFAYIETIDNGEKIWSEFLVAWQGKSQGVYSGKTIDGEDIVIRTPEAIALMNKTRKPKRVTVIDLDG